MQQALRIVTKLKSDTGLIWVSFPDTIHETLSHSKAVVGKVTYYKSYPAQITFKKNVLTEQNKGFGLKRISEENLEALHKRIRSVYFALALVIIIYVIRPTREMGARTNCLSNNMTDIMTK